MADVPSPEVTQSQGLSRDFDATRAPDPDFLAPASAQATQAPPQPPAQLKVWGNFQLLQLLGRGGFGEVYRAWDPVLEREVALKLLLPRGLDPEQEFTAIVAEARAMARVQHPNIVPVYGVDRREERVGFWSEFVRGQTLQALIAAQGAMDVQAAAQITAALCDALSAVHAAGLLHRDIKPGNAMRSENGRILLMDFGLSQNLLAGSGWSGTPAYMAPEVAAGRPATVQSDLFAMGVLLRFLATGSVAPSAVLPQPLSGIVKRAVEADPQLRYASAAQLRADLARAFEEKAAALPAKTASTEKEENKSKRRWLPLWLIALVVLLAVVFVFGPRIWQKLHDTSLSVAQPGYQDTLAANDTLNRYDITGNTDKAIGLYQEALKRNPNDALAEAGLAQAYWRKYQDTNENKWADAANDASAKAMTMNENLAPVQMTAGSIHVDQGKFDVGIEELQKAEQLDPMNAAVHAAMAEAYRQQGRIEDAKQEYEKAIDLDSDNWRWPYLQGAMQLDAGDLTGAEQSFKTALEKAPQNARVLYDLGIDYRKQGRLDEARKVLEQSIALDARADPIMELGQVYLQQANFAKAIDVYRRAVQLSPDDYDPWGNLAAAYTASGQHPQEAEEAFKKAIALAEVQRKSTPDDSYLISMLGRFYANMHDKVHALPLIREALALAPNDPDVVESVAESYEDLGQRHEALEYIAQALQLGYSPSYAKADPALKTLRKDPDAPPAIRETVSTQNDGGKK